MSHEAIAKTFSEWAQNGHDAGMEEDHGDVVAQVVKEMKIRPGELILDLGCGNGWATRMIAKAAAGSQAVGIDASEAMIKRAEELHSFTIRARYEVGHFENLDLPDAHFDRVFSMEAFYYAPDLEQTLAEAHRVLKPGGRAEIVVNYYADSPGTKVWQEHMDVPMRFLAEAEWKAAFEGAGFTEVETRRVVDTRGPGQQSDFQASKWCPDWDTKVAVHEAGSLWIRALKPA